MKTKSFVMTLVAAASMFSFASGAQAQGKAPANAPVQGMTALAEEVATLRAMVESLNDQINNSDPYVGTYTVTLVETALFGCGPGTPQPSSVSSSASSSTATADGTTLSFTAFNVLTQELKLNGALMSPQWESIMPPAMAIASNGKFSAQVNGSLLTGQFSDDGSMFSALVVGNATEGNCKDVWTANLLGVRK